MTRKIFKSILSVALVVLIAGFAIITGVLYKYFSNIQENQLKDELRFAVSGTEERGEDYLKSLDSERYRLTWVASDGNVIFDNRADVAKMENHRNREEIKKAMLTGKGSSIRQSSTLTEQTIYEAVRLNDGSVLRISISRATAFMLVIGMLPSFAFVLVIAVVLSAILARKMATKIVEPLNKLDLENPMQNDEYEEVSPLLYRIHEQQLEIKEQMRILKQKKDEFDQITENMKEALVLLDNNGRVLSINPAAKALFDTDDSHIGEDFLTIDRRKDMRRALQDAEEKGHTIFRNQKNGREYQFDLSLIESSGSSFGTVILAFDVTEQVNAEKHRREFTANVSHELKTPLQSIIGSAELMENGIVKDEDIPRFIGRIRKEASRLVILIDDIIRLSQLDEGSEMPCEDISIREIAWEVCKTLKETATLKDVSLQITGDEGRIRGVRRLIYEIVYNLCDNSVKYNKPGGRVEISVSTRISGVILCVSDTGIGIDSKHHDKIFERFYCVDKSHSKQSGGTGLGLSIVKHAVTYHHGEITVESEPGNGTKITVTFPKNESC